MLVPRLGRSPSPLGVRCTRCDADVKDDGTYLLSCPTCGGILDVVMTEERLRTVDDALLRSPAPAGIDHYGPLLPIRSTFPWASLGEGNTPLVSCPRLAASLGVERLWVKNEGQNPTGSFKDRPISVAIAKAMECGATGLITSSSGNAGAALAAYAARAGVPAWVIVPERTPNQNVRLIAAYGATILKARGDVAHVHRLCLAIGRAFGWTNVTTTFLSPFPTEGNKTVAYELALQRDWRVPDWILVPVGAGPLPYGIFKGYLELQRLGLIDTLPKMVAVQAAGCAPIVRAFDDGSPVRPWADPRTIAKGIADPLTGYEQDGDLLLTSIARSGGTAVAVDDAEILDAARLLARCEGVVAEPTGAVAVAAVRTLKRRGLVAGTDDIVAVVTGSGLKEVDALAADEAEPTTIEPTLDAFREAIGA
jgi:threonine synthase